MLLGSPADMAGRRGLAKPATRPFSRTMDHDRISTP
jgi:hypothetical protein